MNGRLVLLIVAAAVFVRLWMPMKQAPYPPKVTQARQRVSIHPAAQITARGLVRVAASAVSKNHASAPETARSGEDGPSIGAPQQIEHWTEASSPIALPPDLEPGSYRVIDQSGRVALLEVRAPAETFGCRTAPTAAPEFFVIRNDSTTWYFVRLTIPGTFTASRPVEPEVPPVPVPEYTLPEPAIGNRKFDFTGYDQEIDATTSATIPDSSIGATEVHISPDASGRHAGLRFALMQRDAERSLQDAAKRLAMWWQQTTIAIRQAETTPITPSL